MTQVDILRLDVARQINELRGEVAELTDTVRELDNRLRDQSDRLPQFVRITIDRDALFEPVLGCSDGIHRESELQGLNGPVQIGEAVAIHESSSRVGDEAATSSSHGTVGEPSDEAGGVVSSPPPASSGQGHTTPRVDFAWPNDDVRGL